MYYLYRHIKTDSKKPFYIGIGKIDKSYSRSNIKHNRSKEWKSIVDNYNYEVEIILERDTLNEIYEKEIEFIKLYERYELVNKTKGGGGTLGHIVTEEVKNKLSKINSGSNHPQYGTKASIGTRLKQSIKKIGDNNISSKKCKCLETGEVFSSLGEASVKIYGDRSKHKKVSDIIKGRRKTHLGFSFELIKA